MQGFQFYEEFRDETLVVSADHVIAIPETEPIVREGAVVCNAFRTMKSPETGTDMIAGVLLAAEYLGTHCKEVSEERAREIQPQLFEYLDRLA
jgi:hypothetical protein